MKTTMPAPNINENSPRILPSKKTQCTASVHRLIGSFPPHRFGFWYAANGIPKTRMFISRMPSSAAPRSTSNVRMRSWDEMGWKEIITRSRRD